MLLGSYFYYDIPTRIKLFCSSMCKYWFQIIFTQKVPYVLEHLKHLAGMKIQTVLFCSKLNSEIIEKITNVLLEVIDFRLKLLLRHPRVLQVFVVLQPQLVLALRLCLVNLLLKVEDQPVFVLQLGFGNLEWSLTERRDHKFHWGSIQRLFF